MSHVTFDHSDKATAATGPKGVRAPTPVVHVTPMAERGGLEVVLLNLLRHLDLERFSPLVVFLADGPFVAEVEREGFETIVVPVGRARNVVAGARAIATIARLLRRRRAGLVHTWHHKAHLYGGVAAASVGAKRVYHVQVTPAFRLSRDGLLTFAASLVSADAVIACSRFVASHLRGSGRLPREVHVVYNGTDQVRGDEAGSQAVRAQLGIAEDVPLVLLATRLQKWKGVHIFLEAAARVLPRLPDAQFVIVGGTLFGLDTDYPSQLERLSLELGIQQAVRFVGFQQDVGPYFNAADLVVHCSIEPEPFGMVLIEAMSRGKAVIATEAGGPAEILQDGISGLLVPPGDARRLADAELMLLTDAAKRTKMGAAGRARVREHFTAEHMARQVQRVYEGVLTTTAARQAR